mmetsp:Transcript_38668/g.74147  ORF Transcript_38668/g.74147 Transcript_38668/m.74147 type:complete len:574 (-) Transcript_38668:113-1834(-)
MSRGRSPHVLAQVGVVALAVLLLHGGHRLHAVVVRVAHHRAPALAVDAVHEGEPVRGRAAVIGAGHFRRGVQVLLEARRALGQGGERSVAFHRGALHFAVHGLHSGSLQQQRLEVRLPAGRVSHGHVLGDGEARRPPRSRELQRAEGVRVGGLREGGAAWGGPPAQLDAGRAHAGLRRRRRRCAVSGEPRLHGGQPRRGEGVPPGPRASAGLGEAARGGDVDAAVELARVELHLPRPHHQVQLKLLPLEQHQARQLLLAGRPLRAHELRALEAALQPHQPAEQLEQQRAVPHRADRHRRAHVRDHRGSLPAGLLPAGVQRVVRLPLTAQVVRHQCSERLRFRKHGAELTELVHRLRTELKQVRVRVVVHHQHLAVNVALAEALQERGQVRQVLRAHVRQLRVVRGPEVVKLVLNRVRVPERAAAPELEGPRLSGRRCYLCHRLFLDGHLRVAYVAHERGVPGGGWVGGRGAPGVATAAAGLGGAPCSAARRVLVAARARLAHQSHQLVLKGVYGALLVVLLLRERARVGGLRLGVRVGVGMRAASANLGHDARNHAFHRQSPASRQAPLTSTD